LPTYSERECLPILLEQLKGAVPFAHVLVVDDNSTDGTGKLADSLAADDARIYVMHRSVKDGLGRAYVDAFGWALLRGYDRIIQMDADLSHAPAYL
ncbi:MAG: glycosyltransferase, partial [Armatimonadetes bacterium]|nr:glycosyltransferase [Armatimonadota bacterium]